MSLTARLTAYFLGALALMLAGSGLAVYALAANYLARQQDDRLTSALDTLSASSEVNPEGAEWEPNDRNLTLGRDEAADQVRWTVHDGAGRLVGRSPNLGGANIGDADWLSRSRTIEAPKAAGLRPEEVRPAGARTLYGRLVLTAAISPVPAAATLRRLALALAGTGFTAWSFVALPGWKLCRRALSPVRRMAADASAMSAADLGRRLRPPGTNDELEELGRAFNGLLGRLEAAFEKQRRFTGDAAHQLSTPLTVLLGQLEVALRRERTAADYRAALAEAHVQAVHLRRIVELLLFLARPDADAALPESELVDLSEWVPAHLRRWEAHPRRGDLRFVDEAGGAVSVRVAPALLGQLLDNLLDNACKYSPPGTPVTVYVGRSSAGATVGVADQGVGVAADDLVHIFEPFYRSPDARRLGKPGVGLGLAVARRLAEALGGGIKAESKPGLGSRFEMWLPTAGS